MGKRVLLIEDEQNIAEAIRFILSREGHEVRLLTDGNDVLPVLRAWPPDLVILDLMLPSISGLDVLDQIRQDPACQNIPVMMLTARGQSRDRDVAISAGVSAFMTKPFSNDDIRTEVRRLLEGRPPAPTL